MGRGAAIALPRWRILGHQADLDEQFVVRPGLQFELEARAVRIERRFTIAPHTLVLASAPDVPLLIAHGLPGVAAGRNQDVFVIGLLGAVLAIGSAIGLALVLSGGFGS